MSFQKHDLAIVNGHPFIISEITEEGAHIHPVGYPKRRSFIEPDSEGEEWHVARYDAPHKIVFERLPFTKDDLAFVNSTPFIINEAGAEKILIHPEGRPDAQSLLVKSPEGEWRVYEYEEPHEITFQRSSPPGSTRDRLELQRVYTENPTCLLEKRINREVWRILNVPEPVLNYFRNWLERSLITVAINWVVYEENTSTHQGESLAERIGFIPVVFNPMLLDKFTGDLEDEKTTLAFNIDVHNSGSSTVNVTTDDLKWIPFGDQAGKFPERPHPLYSDQVITKLRPDRRLKITAYAIRGTGEENAKWSSVTSHFRLIPTKNGNRPAVRTRSIPETPSEIDSLPCEKCEDLPGSIKNLPGLICAYLTIRLVGGLGFDDIQEQLDRCFEWGGIYPVREVKYNLPPRSEK